MLLREWRAHRGVSQLRLAILAETSQRHLSFIESGRAQPSRSIVLRLAEALDLPLRARNELLGAAGFAAHYPERPLDAAALTPEHEALQRILAHHDPFPAMVLDSAWDVLEVNRSAERLIARLVDVPTMLACSTTGRLNLMRAVFHSDGIRRRIRNWDAAADMFAARLRRESMVSPRSPAASLLSELSLDERRVVRRSGDHAPVTPTISLDFDVDGAVLRLFNTLTTFGTAQDVTLQELRIEMSFPADADSAALLNAWSDLAK